MSQAGHERYVFRVSRMIQIAGSLIGTHEIKALGLSIE
jgi:hypothetical protein